MTPASFFFSEGGTFLVIFLQNAYCIKSVRILQRLASNAYCCI